MTDIGNKIRELRIKNNFTQAELGDLLYVSDKTISSWESNRTLPDISMLRTLCKNLNTSFMEFFGDVANNSYEVEVKLIQLKFLQKL